MPVRNPFLGRAVMRVSVLPLVFALCSAASAAPPGSSGAAVDARPLTDAIVARPLHGAYRHRGGACLKSGAQFR